MAFCPECGKSAAPEATKCIHCGTELAAPAKPAGGGARFKGTMMMQTAPVVAPPASAPAAPAPAAEPAPAAAPAPVAAAPTPSPVPAASAVPKPGLKATMVGGGIVMPPSAAGAAGGADEARKKMAFAATAPAQAAFQIPTTPAATPAVADSSSSTEKKVLPGDPMAPAQSARGTGGHRASQSSAPPPAADKTWLYVVLAFVGMIVIGGIGLGVAMKMGLVHLGK
jgi:hypothetical protein